MLHAQHCYQKAIQDAACSSGLTSAPSAYVNWLSFFSTVADATVSPARNVLSIVLLVIEFFSFVRTKAAPLPGFTCKCTTTAAVVAQTAATARAIATAAIAFGPMAAAVAAASRAAADVALDTAAAAIVHCSNVAAAAVVHCSNAAAIRCCSAAGRGIMASGCRLLLLAGDA